MSDGSTLPKWCEERKPQETVMILGQTWSRLNQKPAQHS